MQNIATLLEQSQSGNHQAFGLLVEKFLSPVCATAYSITGCPQQSEDIAQETFILAWQKIRDVYSAEKLGPWFCAISRNMAREWLKKQSRHKVVSLAKVPEPAARQDTNDDEKTRRQKLVWQSLKNIPENYREVLVLFYRQDKSTKEVAQVLDISEDAVRQRLTRGRDLLKKEVASIVEDTLNKTAPTAKLSTGVLAAITGTAIASATTTTANAANASATATATATATTTASKTILGTMTAKLATAAAVCTVTTAVVYTTLTPEKNPTPKIKPSGPLAIAAIANTDSQNIKVKKTAQPDRTKKKGDCAELVSKALADFENMHITQTFNDIPLGYGFGDADLEIVSQAFSQHKDTFDSLLEIEKYKTCNFGFSIHPEMSDEYNRMVETLAIYRAMVHYLCKYAIVLQQQGKPELASKTMLSSLSMARVFQCNKTILSHLVNMAYYSITIKGIERLINLSEPTPEDLQKFLAELQLSEKTFSNTFRKNAVEYEFDFIQDSLKKPPYNKLPPPTEYDKKKLKLIVQKIGMPFQSKERLAIEAEIKLLKPKARHIIINQTLTGMERAFLSSDRCIAMIKTSITGIAIIRFKQDKKRFPESLSELVPDYLTKPPVDHFGKDSELMKYKKPSNEEFIVYSIGADGIDNNGDIIDNEHRDISFRMQNIKTESPDVF